MAVDYEDRKKQIFDVALGLFAKNGYNSVSVRQIAPAVGLHPATLYHYYSSKEEILTEIFERYDTLRWSNLPHLSKLLKLVETEPPHEVLAQTIAVYPAEILPFMSSALRIANSMSTVDERASEIMDSLMNTAGDYARPLLRRMLELDLIEPIDIDNFALVFNCFCFSAAVRHYEDKRIANENYAAGLKLIFQLVKVKEK